jgi:hypothetical protein
MILCLKCISILL